MLRAHINLPPCVRSCLGAPSPARRILDNSVAVIVAINEKARFFSRESYTATGLSRRPSRKIIILVGEAKGERERER